MTANSGPEPRPSGKPIRVLIVDDSAVVRSLLSRHLSHDAGLEVVAAAPDPYVARDKIVDLEPDVITLDVEMPRMDGITFLRRLMRHFPKPVVVLSSLTGDGTRAAVEAMAAGAVDVLCKPTPSEDVESFLRLLVEKIRLASRAHVRPLIQDRAVAPHPVPEHLTVTTAAEKIFALGASTGGVQALTEILTALPSYTPGTLVVQHMPPRFTASFAKRLDTLCAMSVKEAADGDTVMPGRVLIAPGGLHMLLRRAGSRYYVEVKEGPEVCHQRPSVDVLFNSVAKCCGTNAVGAILTGMGADGARGLLNMRCAGAHTLAQDEQTSTVYGMPMEAIKRGAAEQIVPLQAVAATLMTLASSNTHHQAHQS